MGQQIDIASLMNEVEAIAQSSGTAAVQAQVLTTKKWDSR
jgi:hypothetical protein